MIQVNARSYLFLIIIIIIYLLINGEITHTDKTLTYEQDGKAARWQPPTVRVAFLPVCDSAQRLVKCGPRTVPFYGHVVLLCAYVISPRLGHIRLKRSRENRSHERLCSVIHVRTQPGVLRYARFVDVGGGKGGAYAGRNWQRSVIGRHGCSCTSYTITQPPE